MYSANLFAARNNKRQINLPSTLNKMAEKGTISNKAPLATASDYTKLRELGIGYIEKFAREVWTDYNKHDPGITTLEMLCYAITDLSLRTQLPMQDLLASSWGNASKMRESFATADLVLPMCPVTELDYRKLFIDIDGVRNAWLLKAEKDDKDSKGNLVSSTEVFVDCELKTLSYSEVAPPKKSKSFELNGLYDIKIDFDNVFVSDLLAIALILIEKLKGTVLSDAERKSLDASLDINRLYGENKPFFDALTTVTEADKDTIEESIKSLILTKVKEKYRDNRSLCEDIEAVKPVPVQNVMFCADVEIAADAAIAEVYAHILLAVQKYLDPPIKRYSLAEMTEKKDAEGTTWTLDQIFEGPLLQNGFIIDEELEAAQLREELYTSDIINRIMDIKDVLSVKKVRLNILVDDKNGGWTTKNAEGEQWRLKIDKGHQPQLHVEKAALAFYKNIIPVGSLTDKTKALTRLKALQKVVYESNKKSIDAVPVPEGTVFDLGDYTSVINEFPQNYGIGYYGLPDSATTERKAKAKQFKGYLLFFDQILTNYLAQLKSLNQLFAAEEHATTYFSQPITDVVDIKELYDDPSVSTDDFSKIMTPILEEVSAEQEKFAENPIRKNRFLDHLLARFAENFSDYALLMFSLFGERTGEEVLQDKVAFIKDFYESPPRGATETEAAWQQRCREHFHHVSRARAYNYCEAAWNNDTVAGVTRRIARLTGIRNHKAHTVSDIQLIDTPKSSEVGNTDKFHYQVSFGSVVFKSKKVFKDGKTALKAGERDLMMPVPHRERFELTEIAATSKWFFILNNEKKDIEKTDIEIARSTDFATEKDARTAVDDLLEHLIYDGESLALVEHILLRPDKNNPNTEGWLPVCTEPDCSSCEPLDPYSYRVSIVLPGYTTRFRNINYRRYLERIIREELPAHVLARICWVGRKQLLEFETAYEAWLTEKAKVCVKKDDKPYADALHKLITILNELHTIYDTGVLHDCDTADENTPIILGQSALAH
jgi:uncharacterized protein